MNSITTKLAVLLAGAGLVLAGLAGRAALDDDGEGADSTPAANAAELDVSMPSTGPGVYTTQQQADFWAGRVDINPDDYLSRSKLASTLVRQARETGDTALYDQAGSELQQVLATNPDDISARTSLATVRLSQHRFDDAARLATAVYATDPGSLDALAVLGDAQLESGDYDGARATFEQLGAASSAPAVLIRLSNLARIEGDPEALTLARDAAAGARALDLAGESRAFYEATYAQELFDRGRVDEAAAHYEAALEQYPPYHIGLEGLAKVRIAQGRPEDAEALYLQVRAITPPPDFPLLVSLGDLATSAGDTDAASDYYAEALTAADGVDVTGPLYAREFSRYYSDHDLEPERALALAQADLAHRRDVYAYDTLAWALYRNQRYAAAESAAEQALATGIKDPSVLYHAGMIAAARGDKDNAAELLGQALELNPDFDVLQAPVARATLAAQV
ncbi:MAG: tetratricopeptide repeat protein [Acidimicrobiia bacterium]